MIPEFVYNKKWQFTVCLTLGTGLIFIIRVVLLDQWDLSVHILNKDKKRLTEDSHSDDITLVTAYFDLGTFQKGDNFYIQDYYFEWAKIYKHVDNPLVCYTDSTRFVIHMTSLRMGKENKTKIFYIQRNSSWAFQLEPRVKEVISQPGYPKYHPNTVLPRYPCAMFAKYDVIERASRGDYFKTKYIAWTDIGNFRAVIAKRDFKLVKLDSHNESRVAMSKVENATMDISPRDIFYDNLVWVGGAFILGNRDVMIKFANQFKRAVDYFLSHKMINTDQQVLYAIFSDQGRKDIKPEIEIQCSQATDWFGLGLKMIQVVTSSNRRPKVAFIEADNSKKLLKEKVKP